MGSGDGYDIEVDAAKTELVFLPYSALPQRMRDGFEEECGDPVPEEGPTLRQVTHTLGEDRVRIRVYVCKGWEHRRDEMALDAKISKVVAGRVLAWAEMMAEAYLGRAVFMDTRLSADDTAESRKTELKGLLCRWARWTSTDDEWEWIQTAADQMVGQAGDG